MPRDFDAIVIGTGQSGPALARRMAGEGWRVAVLERDKPGGTCVNTGCIPTKTLVASARVAAMARRAAEYGVELGGPVRVDMRRVKERMRAVSGKSRQAVARSLEQSENITFVRGHGRFLGPDSVAVGGDVLRAKKIFVNVGARAARPDMPGAGQVPSLDNSSFLELDELPAHLVVVGGSYIGLEFGQMYRRFGSEVTILQRGPRLVPREDEDVSQALRALQEKEGISVRVDAECTSVSLRGSDIVARVSCDAGAPEVVGTHLLFATGRVPNTDDLGLEEAGVKTDARGMIVVDEELRTSVPGIWALGDCNGRGGFTHTSYNDYEIVADNLLDGASRKWTDRVPVYALYTDPPLGRVGMGEAEIRKAGIKALAGKRPMTHVSRAVEKGETLGFLKIHVEASSRRILGASLLGTSADEVVHSLIDAVYSRMPVEEFQRHVRIHPNVSELLPTVLEDLKPLA